MDKAPRVGVGVFVFKDGKFLMGQRHGAHGAGSWSVPSGHLEFGETPEETATREVLEETSLEIANVAFAAITNDIFLDDEKHYVTLWMTSHWKAGEATITEPDKFIDQEWFDFDNLPEPLFLPWRELLQSSELQTIKQKLASTRNEKG